MKTYGISNNNITVYAHPEGHPHREDILAEAINKISLPTDATFHRETVDLGRVIGVDHLVETNDDAQVVMFRRGNRPGESRMVLNQPAAPTSKVTIVLCVATDPEELAGKWVVVTAFEGEQGKPEPFDRRATAEDAAWWEHHALVPTPEELAQILG